MTGVRDESGKRVLLDLVAAMETVVSSMDTVPLLYSLGRLLFSSSPRREGHPLSALLTKSDRVSFLLSSIQELALSPGGDIKVRCFRL